MSFLCAKLFSGLFPAHSRGRSPFFAQKSCHRDGFTLVEVMIVIVIIGILASMMAAAVNTAKEKARQTDCMSNLRQIGVALVTYRGDHAGRNPNWTSNLYPTYIDDLGVYVCRSDLNRGRGRCRPYGIEGETSKSGQKEYAETIDNDSVSRGSGTEAQNKDVVANSYMYEFSCAKCGWSVPEIEGQATWAQYKEYELRQGNDGKPYSSARLPIVRCYHHALNSRIDAHPDDNKDGKPDSGYRRFGMTINVAYAGNVTIAPLWWQGAVGPGENLD